MDTSGDRQGNTAFSASDHKAEYASLDKISVVIPCYNRRSYIRKCADSLIGQTYPAEFIELIFVDDGSTDETVDILKEYERRHPEEILIVELSENSGCPGYVRNVGIQYASGEYLMFVDSDDVVDRDILNRMHDLALEHDADIVSANMQMFYEDQILMTEAKDDRLFDTSDPQTFIDLLGSEGSDGHIGARLYKKSFLDEHAISFPENRHVSEDTFFNMSCLMTLKRYYRTSDVLYFYRNNPSGLWRSNSQPPEQILECLLTQEELMPLYRKRVFPLLPAVAGWFFFQALRMVRMRLFDMGQQDFYYSNLPDIKKRVAACVPDILANPVVLGMTDEVSVKLREELV